MRKYVASALVGFFLMAAAGPVFAKPEKRFDRATATVREMTYDNLRDGSRIFAEVCKGCHHRDNDKGAAFLHTESKTMRAWNRVFYERYPKCAADGAWKALSADDLLKLNDYLFVNAVDTVDVNCYL